MSRYGHSSKFFHTLDTRVRENTFERMVRRAEAIVREHKEQQSMQQISELTTLPVPGSIRLVEFLDGPLVSETRRVDVGTEDPFQSFTASFRDVHGEQHTYRIGKQTVEASAPLFMANYVPPRQLSVQISENLAHAIIDYNDIGYNEGLGASNGALEEAWRALVQECEKFIERPSIQTRAQVTQIERQQADAIAAQERAQAGEPD